MEYTNSYNQYHIIREVANNEVPAITVEHFKRQ